MHFLGKNIRYLRKETKKTQTELAVMIGKRQTTIGNWENGISEPSIEELILLSDYFGAPLDILIKIDLAQTNWKTDIAETQNASGRIPGKYDHTTGPIPLAQEESMTYVLEELRSIRKEIDEIKANLP